MRSQPPVAAAPAPGEPDAASLGDRMVGILRRGAVLSALRVTFGLMSTGASSFPSRPYVVAHVAVSMEGATDGFEPDLAQFYRLVATWPEDVTLVGSDTILAQERLLASAVGPGPAVSGPLLAVVDGQGRVREWGALRNAGHWSEVLALHAEATPPRPAGRAVREIVVGADRVDLAGALDVFAAQGIHVVRVDSGGSLIGALLDGGLLDEVSLLIHPLLAGAGGTRRSFDGRARDDDAWQRHDPASGLVRDKSAAAPVIVRDNGRCG